MTEKITDPNLLAQLNAPGGNTPIGRPVAQPSPQAALSQNPLLRAKQLNNLLDQASLAKTPDELNRLHLEVKKLQQDIAKGPGINETQSKAMARYVNEKMGENIYQFGIKNNYEPTTWRNFAAASAEGIPKMGIGLSDLIRDPVSIIGRTGERLFEEGVKRELTGAATNQQEPGQINAQYYPTAFQPKIPALRLMQQGVRQAQIAAAQREAGLNEQLPTLTPEQVASPKVPSGTRFIGADGKTRTKH